MWDGGNLGWGWSLVIILLFRNSFRIRVVFDRVDLGYEVFLLYVCYNLRDFLFFFWEMN